MTTMTARVGAVLAALLLVACSPAQSEGAGAGPTPVETPVISGEPAGYNADDVAFATGMVAHHKQAIELSRLALERSTNPQVQQMAEQIVAVQQPEINILNVFLVQWNENPEVGDSGGAGGPADRAPLPGMADDATIERLRSRSGVEFDSLWLESMIAHHRGAVAMAEAQIADGDNVDAVAMARQMVITQQAEIERMGQLQKELG